MKKLTKIEKIALAKVFMNLCECGMFVGKYDAKNGNKDFMYGIQTVMENLAYTISDKVYNTYNDVFVKNMIESEKKALDKKQD